MHEIRFNFDSTESFKARHRVREDNEVFLFTGMDENHCEWDSIKSSSENSGFTWHSDSFCENFINYHCCYSVFHLRAFIVVTGWLDIGYPVCFHQISLRGTTLAVHRHISGGDNALERERSQQVSWLACMLILDASCLRVCWQHWTETVELSLGRLSPVDKTASSANGEMDVWCEVTR